MDNLCPTSEIAALLRPTSIKQTEMLFIAKIKNFGRRRIVALMLGFPIFQRFGEVQFPWSFVGL